MKQIKHAAKAIESLSNLEATLDNLSNIITPSNYKILLGIAIKLYEDEVLRYRFLEEKSTKLLTLIIFLITTLPTLFYWIYTKDSSIFDNALMTLIAFSFCILFISLMLIFITYSISSIPTLEISKENMHEASTENFNTLYNNYLKAYRKSYRAHRTINNRKAKYIDMAHKLLVLFTASLIIEFATILLNMYF